MQIKNKAEIARIREAGRVVASALKAAGEMIAPGVTTGCINARMEEVIDAWGAQYAFPLEAGFPTAACISVNEEVVHGVPGDRVLQEGDIVSVDVGARLDGFIGDAAWTFPVGRVGDVASALLDAGRNAMLAGTSQARDGNSLDDIGRAVESSARAAGFHVVRDFVGHGVGRHLHEEPQVPNYSPVPKALKDITLREGMVLAVEPMLNVGTHKVDVSSDGWTVVTHDGSLSCHFEHTVAVGPDGGMILTAI
ncbi:MAG: type I methionyl aminopeptidase [Planctomycetes bacterium]|nr:type I methionyl aminopeptidase [Planctomycetota bacterium]